MPLRSAGGAVLRLGERPGWVGAAGIVGIALGVFLIAGDTLIDGCAINCAVQLAPLSHVAPAREVSMPFAALLGGRLPGETDRGLRLLGAGFVAAGVIALAMS